MKICFITSNIFSLGGVQRVVSVLSNELSKKHEVTILCTSDLFPINRRLYSLNSDINIKINSNILNRKMLTRIYSKVGNIVNSNTNLLKSDKLTNLLLNIYYPREIRDKFIVYFKENEYDVVIGVEGYYSLLLGTISENINAKTIGWQHNSYEAYLNEPNKYYWKQDKLFELLIPKLDKYIVLTEYDKLKFKMNNNINCTVVHNPRSFSSNLKSNIENKCFLAAGRFVYQKGFDLLLESFSLFSQKNDDWNLTIVGEGPEKGVLNDLIKEYSLEDRISVKPFTDNIQEFFLKSSILLLPSRWEGMPMIVLEAFEMGVPVISYDISASQQLIEDEMHGLLVPKFDTDKYAEAMLRLSKSYDLRKKISMNVLEKSDDFKIEKVAENWQLILDSISNKY